LLGFGLARRGAVFFGSIAALKRGVKATRDRAMQCPNETTVTLFTDAALDPSSRASIAAHLDECPSCRRLVAELVRARGSRPSNGSELPPLGEHPEQALSAGADLGHRAVNSNA